MHSYINTKIRRVHGSGITLARKEGPVDFSYGINPYTLDLSSLIDFSKIQINQYPDQHAGELKIKLATLHKIKAENLFIGNGSAEIIFLIFFCFVREGDHEHIS